MKKKDEQTVALHAGHFLRDVLQEQGHDVAWLAERTGRDEAFVANLLEQPNMDAELFVRMGMPMEPLFFTRLDELIFADSTTPTA